MRSFIVHKLAPLLVLFLVVGHSPSAFAQSDDSLSASIRKSGQLKMAMASVPPWTFVAPSGEAKGYTVEMVNIILKGMGLPTATAILTTWDTMIPGLQAHQVDMVAPGLNITDARCKVVLFSAPTGISQDALYVPAGNAKRLTGYSQVAKSPEIKLAVLTGSSQEAYALKQGVKPEQLVRVPDTQAGIATISGGRSHAFALGQFSIADPAKKGLDVVVDKLSPVNGWAAAFRKEDVRFRDAFDKQLDLLRSNGALTEFFERAGVPQNVEVLSKYRKASDLVPNCE